MKPCQPTPPEMEPSCLCLEEKKEADAGRLAGSQPEGTTETGKWISTQRQKIAVRTLAEEDLMEKLTGEGSHAGFRDQDKFSGPAEPEMKSSWETTLTPSGPREIRGDQRGRSEQARMHEKPLLEQMKEEIRQENAPWDRDIPPGSPDTKTHPQTYLPSPDGREMTGTGLEESGYASKTQGGMEGGDYQIMDLRAYLASLEAEKEPKKPALKPYKGDYVAGKTAVEIDIPGHLADEVQSVSFLVDEKPLGTVKKPPFRATWNAGEDEGIRELRAIVKLADNEVFELRNLVREVVADDNLWVNVVPLNVTVVNHEYLVVRDLAPNDFLLLEDGVPQTISHFADKDIPLSVMVIIDISFSMKGEKLRAAKTAAGQFISTLREGDRAGVIAFDDRVFLLNEPTGNLASLKPSINDLKAGEGTSLFDAILGGITLLERERGRKAIIALSDGEDYHSKSDFQEVIDAARRSDVQIYSIGMYGRRLCRGKGEYHWTEKYLSGMKRPRYWTDKLALRGIKFLKDVTSETGGILYLPKHLYELPYVYQHILFELQNQYLLEYYPSNADADGGWRTIQVQIKGHKFVVRTRTGYYAPSEG
ncbi:VWA domain-containing protein [Acidobacteriota bacterium]